MDFCFGSRADARHLVIVEIRLLDAAILDGDGIVQGGGKPVDRGAFHLRADAVRINGTATIHGVNETVQLHGPIFDAGFRDGGGVGIERKKCGDASAHTFGQRLPPARLLGGELQNSLEPRRIERRCFLFAEPRNLAVLADEFQAKRQRILAGGSRKLINKTFHDEAAAGVFNGAPPRARHARFRQGVFEAEVRRYVRNGSSRAEFTEPRIIRALLAPLGGDRGRSLKMFPRREISIGVQGALHFVIGRRAVKTVLHVVFASPQDHDGLARGLRGYLCRFHHEIRLIAAPKAAAHQRGVHDHFFRRELGSFGDDPLRPLRRLRWNPRFRFVRPNEHGAIHRLHASVRREGQLVDGFDFFCTGTENGVRIAFVAENSSGLGGVREKLLLKFGCRLLRRRAFVPFYFENIAALDGGPGIVRENSDSAGGRSAASAGFKWNDIANTRHGFRFRGVKGGELPAKNRAALDHGKKHTGNTRIDTKLGGTGSFVAAFKAPRVMANDGEVVGVLERNGV